MSDRFVKKVNTPIKKLTKKRKDAWLKYKYNDGKAAEIAKLVGWSALQTIYWTIKYTMLTNQALRWGEEKLEYIDIKNKKGKRNWFKAMQRRYPSISAHMWYYMISAAVIFSGGKIMQNSQKEQDGEGQKKEIVIEKTENKRYKLETNADFDALYQKALPLICLSMFPTETLSLGTYADNGGAKNTIGLGSYWYPLNGDIYSSEWIKVSRHKGVQAKDFSISGNRAMNMVDSWASHREDGRVYKKIRRLLLGSELTVNELAAIYTCTYNNEKNGWDFCKFVRDNYKKPIKCASYLVDLPTYGFAGLLDRHCHEALVYLNLDNYTAKIPWMEIRGISTSVTALETAEFYPMAEDLRKGKLDGAFKIAQKIEKRIFKNGRKVKDIIKDDVGGRRADELLSSVYLVNSIKVINDIAIKQAFNADGVYRKGLEKYGKSDYVGALADFLSIISNGYDGADIRNDVAITYYRLGKYKEAIKESDKALKMGEPEAHAPAYFNKGMCYEKTGNLTKALECYTAAAKSNPNVKVYKSATDRVRREMELQNSQKSKNTAAKKSKFDSGKAKLGSKTANRKMSFGKVAYNKGRV